MQAYERLLKENKIKYIRDDAVAARSTFKIGGSSDISVFPKNTDELRFSLLEARRLGIKTEVIGNASNLLFAFERYHGALVFTSEMNSLSVEENRIYADNGCADFKAAAARYMKALYGVELDADTEIVHAIGSKSALSL